MTGTTQDRKDRLAAHLRAEVLTLGLQPGADLDESRLCARFDLSRTPLREVFRDLAGEGYLQHRANRGVRVSELSHTTLRSFFQAAPLIYAAILQLASQNARADQIDNLKEAQSLFKATLRNSAVSDRALANNRFHEITGDMTSNPYLTPSFHRLLIDHARIGMTFYRPSSEATRAKLIEASDQHDAIIAAIEERDIVRSGELAREHWLLSRDEIERYVMPDGLDASLEHLSDKRPA
jgi:DNA-binding GntR family transcriptional regulator